MKLTLIAVGRRASGWTRDAADEYRRRLPPELALKIVEIPPDRRKAISREAALQTEAQRIRRALPPRARVVALDEKGKQPRTAELARRLAAWMQDGREIAFVIGGADGLDDSVRQEADEVLSLSHLTLPHAMVRVLLLEQIYRAWTILKGHPYHRE
jgi:23S rRNA (pseudouridine1915-N3)-methyltransferase